MSNFYFSSGQSKLPDQEAGDSSHENRKQNYRKPELILYGLVGNLTQATSVRGTEGMATMDMTDTGSMA